MSDRAQLYEGLTLDDAKAMATPTPQHEGPCNRITVSANLYHQNCGEQPTAVPHTATWPVDSDEQPVKRRYALGVDPKPLYTGWLEADRVGLIIVENRVGVHQQVNPGLDELERRKRQVVYISHGGGVPQVVRPGGMAYFETTDPAAIRLYAGEEGTPVTTHVFPR